MRFTTIATILSAISSVLASPRHGPYNVTEEVATGIDYICGGDDGAVIYYPDKESASPLISFAHGYKAGGDKMDPSYKVRNRRSDYSTHLLHPSNLPLYSPLADIARGSC